MKNKNLVLVLITLIAFLNLGLKYKENPKSLHQKKASKCIVLPYQSGAVGTYIW